MKKFKVKLLFLVTFFVCSNSLSIRNFSSGLSNDIEPDNTDYAAVARYVVHKSEWASMSTISTLKSISGFPMVNIISVADSAKDEPSTGNIYFYLTNLDFTGQDLMKNNKLTVMFSNDQDLSCSSKGIDPMEPTCARIMISGSATELDDNSEESQFAHSAFLSRHPAAANWIRTHNFYMCKLDILQIVVLDWYGGPHYVKREDYYNANVTSSGFLDVGFSANAIDNSQSKIASEVFANSKNEGKIKIKIKKGSDAVTIEL